MTIMGHNPGWLRTRRCRYLLALAALSFIASAAFAPARALDPKLIDAARKEGGVTWYTTLVVGQIVRPMIQAFEAKYPGIKVSYVPAPWQETVLRLTNEARAGAVKGDLFDGGITFFPLNAAGLVAPYVVESAAAYPTDFKDPTGLWTANIIQVATPSVNTDQVAEKDAPKTLEDLLDPKWRGKMAWTDSPSVSGAPGIIGNVLMTMGQDKGMAYLEKLATQKIANIPAIQRVVLDQNISGQYPLVLAIYNYHAVISAAQGAPVRWLPLAPILTFGVIGIMKDAPHPNAARLFTEFNMSDEGQRIYAKAGYIPASPAVPATEATLKPDAGHYTPRVMSPLLFQEHEAEWVGIYKRLFQ
jgi:iron(III) transport system substrate-binding protein